MTKKEKDVWIEYNLNHNPTKEEAIRSFMSLGLCDETGKFTELGERLCYTRNLYPDRYKSDNND